LTRAHSSTLTANSIGSSAGGLTTDGDDGSTGTLGTATTTTTNGESTAAHARRKSDKESLRRAIGEKFPYDVRDHGNAKKGVGDRTGGKGETRTVG
jgi:hypothetical protein